MTFSGLSRHGGSNARLTARNASSSSRELHAHLIYFLHSHTVLSSHGSSHLHAQFEYGRAEFLGALHFVRFIRIEQDQRMQVAIARMEHVGATQAELVFHLLDGAQHQAR